MLVLRMNRFLPFPLLSHVHPRHLRSSRSSRLSHSASLVVVMASIQSVFRIVFKVQCVGFRRIQEDSLVETELNL